MFAGKLSTRAIASVGWCTRPDEIAGALIRRLAASLTVPEQNGLVFGDMELEKLLLEHQCSSIFCRIRIGCSRINVRLINRDHNHPSVALARMFHWVVAILTSRDWDVDQTEWPPLVSSFRWMIELSDCYREGEYYRRYRTSSELYGKLVLRRLILLISCRRVIADVHCFAVASEFQ